MTKPAFRPYSKLAVDLHPDNRGHVLFPAADMGIAPAEVLNLHMATIESGHIRGNHLHPEHGEYIFLMSAGLKAVIENPETGEIAEEMAGAEPLCLNIRPGVPHAIVNNGESAGILVCWHDGKPGEIRSERKAVVE